MYDLMVSCTEHCSHYYSLQIYLVSYVKLCNNIMGGTLQQSTQLREQNDHSSQQNIELS